MDKMEIPFTGGRFVASDDELNYIDVLKDFPNAKTIRIITYNISKDTKQDKLLAAIQRCTGDVQIITNVPNRMPIYFNSPAGQNMRERARENIRVYLSKLNPDHFQSGFIPFFNVHNHAKIVGTENIVYIGSANYSNESANNIESGVLIEDKQFIRQLYRDFFDTVKDESLSFIEENFNALRIMVLSLYAKFRYNHRMLLQNAYTTYEGKLHLQNTNIFLDTPFLEKLFMDLDELDSICFTAMDAYDEENIEYNNALDSLIKRFNTLSIDWLKDVISEGGSLYELITYDVENETNSILADEFSAYAYDEYLDEYIEKSMVEAETRYSQLHDEFEIEAQDFIYEIEKILSVLSYAAKFVAEWTEAHVNHEIDNT